MSAACKNKIEIRGFVSSEPERVNEKLMVVRMRITSIERYYSKQYQEYRKNKEIHNVKAFNQNAEFSLNNIKVGDFVEVEGKMHYHRIPVDENSRKIVKPEVIANTVTKLNREEKLNVPNGQDQDRAEQETVEE